MIDLQHQLVERFSTLRDSRQGAVFFVEHGLDAQELDALRAAVRGSLRVHPLESGWWGTHDLPLLVAATEVGYSYRGSGTDFWPRLEGELEFELAPQGRQRIRDLFVRASDRFRGARPPATAWAEAFHLIAWPIAHALLPLEFHRSLAATLADLRVSVIDADDDAIYRAIRFSASLPTARFATLLEDVGVVVALTRSLLRREAYELSAEIVGRISSDLGADEMARRGVAVARSIQRAARASAGGALLFPAATRTKGTLQLRRANEAVLLEVTFPVLDPQTAERLRRVLRRRRFAPQLWGATTRVPSDQLLSGLPFPVKLTAIPASDAPLFPNLEAGEFDAEDLAVLHGFELELTTPQVFAVSADGDIARQVLGTTITGHRTYWALFGDDELIALDLEARSGVSTIGDVGPLHCLELNPSSAAGARALKQLGYDVRLGVSVRFAGTPPVDRATDIPTFVTGDNRVLVPQRLTGEAALRVELDGQAAIARVSEVVRLTVECGAHRVRVSSDTDSREYEFRGINASPPVSAPISLKIRSEERTIQALLGGRFSFVVDGAAPIDGLELTVDLHVPGRTYSATGPLGPVPQPVSTEHSVMKALLTDDVRDQVSGAEAATLSARIGHLAVATWELERLVRPCWWELHGQPKLLSEDGPQKFGVVTVNDPVGAPTEDAVRSGTYLLAPIALDELEFSVAAPFSTLCVAPSRTQLRALSIAKPRLERRRRGRAGVGLEDLTEAYLRWTLAETRSAIGDLHRGQVTACIEEWMTELCCGLEWTQAEATLPRREAWGILEQVSLELGIGRDSYVDLSTDQDTQLHRLAVEEIRRSIPALWARLGPPSDLDDDDYAALDRACASAYEVLAQKYRRRGQADEAENLGEADPGESPSRWDEAFARVREGVELRALAAMLLPSNTASRLMALQVGVMTVDDVVDELFAWASSKEVKKSFAGGAPTRDILKASYALWVEPNAALLANWRAAIDTLLVDRAVSRATRYLALRARHARWGST